MTRRPSILLALLFGCVAGMAHAEQTLLNVTTPDGKHRVEVCDCYRHQVFEVRSRLEPAGPWIHVGANVPALQDVRQDVVVTNDRVVWVQGETASGSNFRLWSTPIDRMGGQVISHSAPQSGVGFDLPIQTACSGREVKFRSDPVIDESFAWYVVPMTGGAIRAWDGCLIFRDGFDGGSVGAWR